MVKYLFELKVEGDNQIYQYALDLKLEQENSPESIFTEEIRKSLKNHLEQQSSCKINPRQLNQIINSWEKEIKQGYRTTQITLKLASAILENLNQLQDKGYQDQPQLIEPPWNQIEPTEGILPPLTLIGPE